MELPATDGLVNPNRQDDLSGLGHLCAAGVAFMALVGLNRALRAAGHWGASAPPDLMAELDLVALATVADVVPLKGLNRAFVRQGLAVARGRKRPGLAALMDVAGLNGPLEAWHFGFLIGPRINAGGRIGDASLGARLLTLDDEIDARAIAVTLNDLNRDRQEIERAAVEEAVAAVEARLRALGDAPVVVAGEPGWHPGVVGLIAARLKERFRRPAFAFALGSGRAARARPLGARRRSGLGRARRGRGWRRRQGRRARHGGWRHPAPDGLEAFEAFVASAACPGRWRPPAPPTRC